MIGPSRTPLVASVVWDRVPLTFTLKVRRLKKRFNTVNYSRGDALSSESSLKKPMVDQTRGLREIQIDQVDCASHHVFE